VILGVVGDVFFSILPKIMDWEIVLGTLGDALMLKWFCMVTGLFDKW